ncbi:MAG: outer membrane protein assembly factor BamB [Burkholderiales bacterium]|nr:outer membrane protein assembly factor BamB [Burkholderiales bacterium]
MQQKWALSLYFRQLFALFFVFLLTACGSSGGRPKPAELQPLVSMIGARQVWVSPIGAGGNAAALTVVDNRVAVASGSGTVAVLDVATGADIWRTGVGSKLTSGVGYDGHLAAVVSERNELMALVGGQTVWRSRLPAAAYSAPLVAGQRVFVLTADRTVAAYDGNSGAKLWSQTRTGEPLVLRQPGVILAVGDTLITGLGGRLVGLNPSNGSVKWEVTVAVPRGGNDIERMVDVLGPAHRLGNQVCVRAYQVKVACVDAQRGTLTWSTNADGRTGLHGDDAFVFGVESNDKPIAWQRANGQKVWSQDKLLNRDLTAPLALGRSVVVGDAFGFMHLLSREDGSQMARLPTDGSPIVSTPVLAGETLLALTRNGNLFAWRPQ